MNNQNRNRFNINHRELIGNALVAASAVGSAVVGVSIYENFSSQDVTPELTFAMSGLAAYGAVSIFNSLERTP